MKPVSTELDAINTMLSVIGEAPVNTLTGTLPADVALAYNTLEEVTREVQLTGWHFNTEENYPLLPKPGSGEIHLPANVVEVTLIDPDSRDIVQRGRKLYDRANHTYKFTETVEASILSVLPFDELPEVFRWYVTVRASRKFQDKAVGSSEQHGYTAEDERHARAGAVASDMQCARPSAAKGNAASFISGWTVGKVLER